MKVLLDTHMVLWWLADDRRLSTKARRFIADPGNTVIVSAATAWEVALKQALGKLRVEGEFERAVEEQGFDLLPVRFAHAAELRQLPSIHRDPFDRMLVAQAARVGAFIVSRDRAFLAYGVDTLPA